LLLDRPCRKQITAHHITQTQGVEHTAVIMAFFELYLLPWFNKGTSIASGQGKFFIVNEDW
jgi:hypothetical protein